MANIKFRYISSSEPGKDITSVLKNVSEFHINEILYEFQKFLEASGFAINGTIQIVQDTEYDIEWDNRPDAERGSFRLVPLEKE